VAAQPTPQSSNASRRRRSTRLDCAPSCESTVRMQMWLSAREFRHLAIYIYINYYFVYLASALWFFLISISQYNEIKNLLRCAMILLLLLLLSLSSLLSCIFIEL
jgi:hypothetical protein